MTNMTRLLVDRTNNWARAEPLIEWIKNPQRKPAMLAFTSGPARLIAYAVEEALQRERRGSLPPPTSYVHFRD